MKIEIDVDRLKRKESVEIEEKSTLKQLCEQESLNLEEYIVSRSGELILADEELQEGDTLQFISVISGG